MNTICSAVNGLSLLSFTYDGYHRVVEPHTHGVDRKGHPALRAYQISGGSESGEYVGWKLFHVDEMSNLQTTGQSFSGPRSGYKRQDKAFSSIYCEL